MSDDFVLVDGEEKRPYVTSSGKWRWWTRFNDRQYESYELPPEVYEIVVSKAGRPGYFDTRVEALDALRDAVAKRDAAKAKGAAKFIAITYNGEACKIQEGETYSSRFGDLRANVDSVTYRGDIASVAYVVTLGDGSEHMHSTPASSFAANYKIESDPSHKPHRLLQFFGAYEADTMTVDSEFHHLAAWLDSALPDNPEKTEALRKLLEAKDYAVRSRFAEVG